MVCSLGQSGVSVNQERIHEGLFYNSETFNKAVILTSMDSEKKDMFLVLQHHSGIGEDNVSLFSCFISGVIMNHSAEIKYLTALLRLFSSLCKGRNFVCKASVNNWFPLKFLISNVWDEQLSIEFRATLLDMIMNLHIDFQPRTHSKKPELIKVLETVTNAIKRSDFNQRHTILNIDSGIELIRSVGKKLTSRRSIASGDTHRKANMKFDSNSLRPNEEETSIFVLKCELIEYMEGLERIEFDVFLLQLLKLANMMTKFEVISTDCSNLAQKKAVFSPLSDEFSVENMDITRLLRAVMKILFTSPGDHTCKSFRRSKSLFLDMNPKPKKQNKKVILKNHAKILRDPLAQYSEGVKKFLEFSITEENDNDVESNEIKCKLEVCELILYALDLRQDYLLNKIVDCYKEKEEISDKELEQLIPPPNKIKYERKKEKELKNATLIEIQPLNLIYPSLIGDVLNLFNNTQNYKLKTKLLSIVLRFFSQRKEMSKNLAKLKIMSTESDPEIFIWCKTNISTFRNLAEQSEIICRYWVQNPALYEKTLEKLETLNTLLVNFEEIMHSDSKLVDGSIVNGQGKVNADRQIMMKNLDFHNHVICLIKDGMFILEKIYESPRNFVEKQAKDRLCRLFSLCFRTLRTFVTGNKKNQKCLHRHISTICAYLKIQVSQIDLICEIFRDNEELCTSISEPFLQQFIDLIVNEGRQTVFLSVFEVIVEVNGRGNSNIQRIVLMLMCQPEVFIKVCYLDHLEKFTFEPNKENYSELYVDQPIVYHAKLINVLTKCGKSSDFQINRAKCQKIIPLTEIFQLIVMEKEFKALEYPLLDFFLKVYLENDSHNEELENNKDFLKVIEIKTREIAKISSENQVVIKNLEKWIEVIEQYSVKYLKDNTLFDFTTQVIENYLKSLESKWFLLKNFKISPSCENSLRNLSNLFKISIVPTSVDFEFAINDIAEIQRTKHEWSDLVKRISGSGFKRYIKEEQNEFLQILFNLTDLHKELSSFKIIESMVNYMSLSINYSPPINILCSLIRFLIVHLQEHSELVKENQEKAKKKLQETYRELDVVNISLHIMCEKNLHIDVFACLICLLNELLDGGNEKVQEECYNFFIIVSDSEQFFARLHSIISDYISELTLDSEKFVKNLKKHKKNGKMVKDILKLLQLLCENHNENLQNYLRIQEKSRNSFDLVGIVIILLQEQMKQSRFESFMMINNCFELLTECIQGPCKKNQKSILNSRFLEISSDLLSLDENSENTEAYLTLRENKNGENYSADDRLKGWMVSQLKYKCLITLLALLEGQTDNFFVIRMARTFNLQIFKENLSSIYKNYYKLYGKGYYHNDLFNNFSKNAEFAEKHLKKDSGQLGKDSQNYVFIIENGFLIFFLLKYFLNIEEDEVQSLIKNELPEILDKNIEEKPDEAESNFLNKILFLNNEKLSDETVFIDSFRFFEKHTGSIEVVFKGVLNKVYFSLTPVCHHLTEEVKNNFNLQADRSSDKKKLEYLISKVDELEEDMAYEEKLSKAFGYKMLTNQVGRFKVVAFLLSIVINIIILLSYSDYGTDRLSEPSFFNVDLSHVNNDRISQTVDALLGLGIVQCVLSGFIFLSFIIKTAPLLVQRVWRKQESLAQSQKKPKTWKKYLKKIKSFLLTCFYILANIDVLYHLFYFSFSIFALTIHPFFYSAHLFDILYRFPSLQNVIKSIVIPWKSYVLTLIFMIILVYLFSVWAYVQFESDFDGFCDSLLLCIAKNFDQGVKNSGGIGEYLDYLIPPTTGTIVYSRFFFDNLQTIIIEWIIFNIIQGYIFVTFTTLRENDSKNFEDTHNKCFICGKEKESIERLTGKPLWDHRKYDHNEWNYLFFLVYLKNKEVTEYSGYESYVKQMYDNKKIDWIPQQKSLSFLKKEKFEESKIEEAVVKAQEDVVDLQKKVKTLKNLLKSDESKYIS